LAILFAIHLINHHALAAGWVAHEKDLGGGILNPDTLRIPGVLQRIGLCYIAAASLALIASWHVLILAIIALLAGYSWLMLKVPYPSISQHGQMVHGLLGEHDNLARYIDTRVLGRHVYGEYPDPEGILSTLPAIATALLGILAGIWLRTGRPAVDRCAGLLTLGVFVACIGGLLDATLMPINKRLWSPSYAVFCAGLGMLGLGAVFYIADVLRYRRWALPFTVYGMNAITAFVLSGIVGRLILLNHVTDPKNGEVVAVKTFLADRAALLGQHVAIGNAANNGSLVYALGYVLFFLILMSIFYRLKIFLKV
jgi:predicted acyltransferase